MLRYDINDIDNDGDDNHDNIDYEESENLSV